MRYIINATGADTVTSQQYQMWLAVWNAGIKQGLSTSAALAAANKAAAAIAG
jgi:hypothetical protein